MENLPIEIATHLYLTKFGGWTRELKDNEVGLNVNCLKQTKLFPYDFVIIKKIEERKTKPLFKREIFKIVPLDKSSPEAYIKSLGGEIVLPYEKSEEEIEEGDYLILNTSLNRFEHPEFWMEHLILSMLKNFRNKN